MIFSGRRARHLFCIEYRKYTNLLLMKYQQKLETNWQTRILLFRWVQWATLVKYEIKRSEFSLKKLFKLKFKEILLKDFFKKVNKPLSTLHFSSVRLKVISAPGYARVGETRYISML